LELLWGRYFHHPDYTLTKMQNPKVKLHIYTFQSATRQLSDYCFRWYLRLQVSVSVRICADPLYSIASGQGMVQHMHLSGNRQNIFTVALTNEGSFTSLNLENRVSWKIWAILTTIWISLSKYMNHEIKVKYSLIYAESTCSSSIFWNCLESTHQLMLYKSKIRIINF
jgi:hypothetical protein